MDDNGNNANSNASSEGMTNLEGFNLGDLSTVKPVESSSTSKTTEQVEAERKTAEQAASTEKARTALIEKAKTLGLPENSTEAEILEVEKTKNQSQGIIIDDEEYQLDKDGNAIAKDGTVFKTKAEIDTMGADEGNSSAIEDFMKVSGIQPVGEDGKPKEYEDSIDGLMQLSIDTGKVAAKRAYEEEIDATPGARKYIEYLRRGGDPIEYHKQVSSSWKGVKFDPKNQDMATNAIVAQLRASGIKEEAARSTAKLYLDTGKLEEMGKDAYGWLTSQEDKRDKDEMEAYNREVEAQRKSDEAHWQELEAKIKTGKIHNIVIPENDRNEFFKYIAIDADKEGNSQSRLDNAKLSTEQLLQLEYLKYKNFDLSKLITAEANTKRVAGIKGRFVTKKTDLSGGEGIDKSKHQHQNTGGNITLESILSGKSTSQ